MRLLYNGWIKYSIRLLLIFSVLYYGSLAITGFSAPGGRFYSEKIDRWFNYPASLRKALLHSTAAFLEVSGYPSRIDGEYKVRIVNGYGVKVVYSCLAIGIISFWIAFIGADENSIKRKIVFILVGVLAIFLINTTRLALLVIAANSTGKSSFISNHHTFFNVVSYGIVLLLMYIYSRAGMYKKVNKTESML